MSQNPEESIRLADDSEEETNKIQYDHVRFMSADCACWYNNNLFDNKFKL